MALINIPPQLRIYVDFQETVPVPGMVLQDVLLNFVTQYPKIKPYLLNDQNQICHFVLVYLNDTDIRFLTQKENTPVEKSDIITVIPAVAGG